MLYFISITCGYEHCLQGFHEFNLEMTASIIMLYFTAFAYLVLALYLYQIVPQTYGVPKKWNFIFKSSKDKLIVADEEETEEPVELDFDSALEDGDS